MKVYLKYFEDRCAYFEGALCENMCEGNFSCYIWDELREGNPSEYKDECPNNYPAEHIICKEAKSIEIAKDEEEGFVRIGRKQWSMDDIILLKVDYGDGWVIEIEQDGNDEV